MSHKKKNPVPSKSLTMNDVTEQVDVTKNHYDSQVDVVEKDKIKHTTFTQRITNLFRRFIFKRTVAIITTKDVIIPTKLKEWIDEEIVIKPAIIHTHHKGDDTWKEEIKPAVTKTIRKKVTICEGILKEIPKGTVIAHKEVKDKRNFQRND